MDMEFSYRRNEGGSLNFQETIFGYLGSTTIALRTPRVYVRRSTRPNDDLVLTQQTSLVLALMLILNEMWRRRTELHINDTPYVSL